MPITDQTTLSLTLRPKNFDEIIGLKKVLPVVREKLSSGAVPRGFIIKGQYGCGKTTLAHIIARYVQGAMFDGQPDVEEVNGANYRKIDDMRQLAERAGTYPMLGTYKVVILDECQQLTKEAQQILLKELEVPMSPTVWILCTTDPEKINQGVRDRCFPVEVVGLNAEERHELLVRAAEVTKRTAPFKDLEEELTKAEISSPRKILMAFESYNAGTEAKAAAASMHHERLPELFDIAMGAVYGKWDESYTTFIKDIKTGQPIRYLSLSEQLKALDDKLKKKPKKVGDEASAALPEEDVVEDEELQMTFSRDQIAQDLRLIYTSLLKNRVIKGGAGALKAAQALNVMATCLGTNTEGMQWALTIAGLYRAWCTLTK